MKMNRWISLVTVLAVGTLIARADGQLDSAAKTSTNAAPKIEKKSAAKPKSAEKKSAKPAKPLPPTGPVTESPIILIPGPATASGDNVNVRGKASFNGEVVAKLHKGDSVTVIEQVILDKPKKDEPTHWAKIGYPAKANVWVHSSYIDATAKTVVPKKLNVRTGPGEHFSIVGVIEKGTAVKEVSTKANWIEIEAPASAYAFVAARYLNQDNKATVPSLVTIQPPTPPITDQVPAVPPLATNTTDVASTPGAEPAPLPPTDPIGAAAPPAVVEEILVPRVVTHEGVVKGTYSIQAATPFGLYSRENGKLINYLYTTSPNLDLKRYKGLHIIVTGEEGLDERWINTPVLTIQRIQVVDK